MKEQRAKRKEQREFKIQNSKFKIAIKREQREIIHYAEREQLREVLVACQNCLRLVIAAK